MKITKRTLMLAATLACLMPSAVFGGEDCDWVVQKGGSATLIIADTSDNKKLYHYAASFDSDDLDYILPELYAKKGVKLRATKKTGVFVLPANLDTIVLVCSTKKLKAWDSRHLSVNVVHQANHNGNLEVEALGGRRDMSDSKDGTPTEKGNDIASYSAVIIRE